MSVDDSVPVSNSAGLKKWVHSLSTQELISAMSFAFTESQGASSHRHRQSSIDGIIKDGLHPSHEFHLFKQMVDLQAPPAVPIFGRAIGLNPASSRGISNGRDSFFMSHRNRFQRPRLFQFIPDDWKDVNVSLIQQKNRHCEKQKRSKVHRAVKYDVIARKFIAPWGDVLSLGCTDRQRIADELILTGTCIHYGGSPESTLVSQTHIFFWRSNGGINSCQHLFLSSKAHVVGTRYFKYAPCCFQRNVPS